MKEPVKIVPLWLKAAVQKLYPENQSYKFKKVIISHEIDEKCPTLSSSRAKKSNF